MCQQFIKELTLSPPLPEKKKNLSPPSRCKHLLNNKKMKVEDWLHGYMLSMQISPTSYILIKFSTLFQQSSFWKLKAGQGTYSRAILSARKPFQNFSVWLSVSIHRSFFYIVFSGQVKMQIRRGSENVGEKGIPPQILM